MSLVKCTICGAVFDGGLAVCPVCGQGPDFFVPVEAPADAPTRDTSERFVILGGGAAGLAAAEAIRARNATATITLVEAEDRLPYHRPMLTKLFDDSHQDLPVHAEAWYPEKGITPLLGRTVRTVNAAAKTVALDDGTSLSYDRCIYALGASNFVPAFAGVTLPEVATIRGCADIRALRGLLARGKRTAAVIGGGVLGLEAAWSLRERGCEVTVIEAMPRLMPRQLDAQASARLKALAERAGIAILTSAATEAILGDGHVTGLRLSGGAELRCDLVVISIGVRANAAILQKAGARANRGILVSPRMETSLPDVYAAGDCAEIDGPNYQLWPAAAEMGRVAGINAAGGDAVYVPASYAVTFHGMNTALYAQGDVGADPEKVYRVETTQDEEAGTLETCYYVEDALCGIILLGDIGKSAGYAEMLSPSARQKS